MNKFLELIGFDMVLSMWTNDVSIAWWKMLLIGTVVLAFDLGGGLLAWYCREQIVVEYGFPRRKKRYVEKLKKSYTIPARLTLINLSMDADRHGVYLLLNFLCNLLNILAMLASIVGFVGCMITLARGWCLTLLLGSVLGVNLYAVALMFIPDLIWLKSERDRYNPFK